MAVKIGMTVRDVLQAAVVSLKKETDSSSLGAAEALANLNQELWESDGVLELNLVGPMGLDTFPYEEIEEETADDRLAQLTGYTVS